MTVADAPISTSEQPTWEVATLFPCQGQWTEGTYLDLTRHTRRLVELNDGRLEVLPMPTFEHQRILGFLYLSILTFLSKLPGSEVIFAPAKVRLKSGRFREPDLLVRLARSPADTSDYAVRVDIAVEIVSPDGTTHDYETKRREYAEAGIREYWIVDPQKNVVTVFALEPGATAYVERFALTPGQALTSGVLPGFSLDVSAIFDAAK